MIKNKHLYLYGLITLAIYVCLYIIYIDSVKRGGMADLGIKLKIIYLIIPIYSLISGIWQRLLIKNIYVFTLINFIMTSILLYLIFTNGDNPFILSLIYSIIVVVFSYITKGIIILFKNKISN